jgi:hypothetical protein
MITDQTQEGMIMGIPKSLFSQATVCACQGAIIRTDLSQYHFPPHVRPPSRGQRHT